ncbi:MAG TPA: glycosyltransferase family 39 protein [Chloroflexota bacterium]|nr:glycosyltransferase family 39 protein [Chloroflexota bacterium]
MPCRFFSGFRMVTERDAARFMSAMLRTLRAHPDALALTLILLAAATLRIIFFPRAPVFIGGDSSQYYVPAHALMVGEGFPLPLKRPPFFPVFVALVGRGFGEDLRNVAAIQHIVGLGTVALTYGIGKLAIGRAAAIVGGLIAAISGGLLIYEHYLMTESTFTFLLSAAVFLYLLGMKRDSTWAYLVSGLAVGLATLNRPHAQMLLAIGPPIVLLHTRRWRPALRAALLSSSVAALLIVPWMARNKLEHGAFTVAGAVGQNLVAQTAVFHYGNFVFYDPRNPPNDPNPKRLQARKFIQARSDDKQEKPWVEVTGVGIHARLMEELKLSENEADSYMRDIAIDAIKARPLTWIRLVFDDFRLLWMGIPDELEYHWKLWETRNWPRRLSYLIGPASTEQEAGFALTDRLVNIYQGPRLGPLIPGLFAIGLLTCAFTPAWWSGLLPGLTALSFYLVSAATVAFVPRYHHPTDPMMHVVAAAGLLGVIRTIKAIQHRAQITQRRQESRPSTI